MTNSAVAVKKAAPVKKVTLGKKAGGKKKGEKMQATAFANWVVIAKSCLKKTISEEEKSREFKGGKGFPIFQNPDYPNAQEDKLVELAKSQGGSVELLVRMTINVNEAGKIADTDMSLFI